MSYGDTATSEGPINTCWQKWELNYVILNNYSYRDDNFCVEISHFDPRLFLCTNQSAEGPVNMICMTQNLKFWHLIYSLKFIYNFFDNNFSKISRKVLIGRVARIVF